MAEEIRNNNGAPAPTHEAVTKATGRAPFVQARSYDAAAPGRLNPHTSWLAMSSADTETFAAGRALRERSRDLVRNNPHAAKAVDSLVTNIIGTGIRPRANTGDKALDKVINDAFTDWCEAHVCDADGQYGFFGLQLLACREMIEGGEVLIKRRIVNKNDGSVPLQLQLLEADFLDPYRNGPLQEGVLVNQGVGIAMGGPEGGKRVLYYLYPQHPGNFIFNPSQPLLSQPVPASEVLHVYEKQRTQARGVPFGVPAFTTLENLAEYELAEIVRKKTEACLAGVVTANDDADLNVNQHPGGIPGEAAPPGVYNAFGQIIEHLEPGMIAYAINGKQITFTQPSISANYNEYKVSQLRSIAAGYRIPYELLSADLSEVNFSSGRLGLVEFRRFVTTVQQNILIPMMLRPVWQWFCEAAYLAKLIPIDTVPVIFSTPAFEYINPNDDVAADKDAIRAGLKSWTECAYERGRDPEALYEEIKEFQRRCAEDGIVLDANAASVSGRGVAQKNAPPSDSSMKEKKKKKDKGRKKKKDDASTDLVDGLPPAE